MPYYESPRYALPYLAVAQAQKEVTHNEALVRIDALLHPVVEGQLAAPPTPSGDSDAGKCWLIANSAGGIWAGHDGDIACWTGNGWRYVPAKPGMRIWNVAASSSVTRTGDGWVFTSSVDYPSGGTVIDLEARAAIVELLDYFRTIGQLAS